MRQFEVNVSDDIGSLEKITDALAKESINMLSISSERNPGESAVIKIVTNNDENTRSVLQSAGLNFQEAEIITFQVPDQPGTLHKLTTQIRDSQINIEAVYLMGKSDGKANIAMKFGPHTDKARELLKDHITE